MSLTIADFAKVLKTNVPEDYEDISDEQITVWRNDHKLWARCMYYVITGDRKDQFEASAEIAKNIAELQASLPTRKIGSHDSLSTQFFTRLLSGLFSLPVPDRCIEFATGRGLSPNNMVRTTCANESIAFILHTVYATFMASDVLKEAFATKSNLGDILDDGKIQLTDMAVKLHIAETTEMSPEKKQQLLDFAQITSTGRHAVHAALESLMYYCSTWSVGDYTTVSEAVLLILDRVNATSSIWGNEPIARKYKSLLLQLCCTTDLRSRKMSQAVQNTLVFIADAKSTSLTTNDLIAAAMQYNGTAVSVFDVCAMKKSVEWAEFLYSIPAKVSSPYPLVALQTSYEIFLDPNQSRLLRALEGHIVIPKNKDKNIDIDQLRGDIAHAFDSDGWKGKTCRTIAWFWSLTFAPPPGTTLCIGDFVTPLLNAMMALHSGKAIHLLSLGMSLAYAFVRVGYRTLTAYYNHGKKTKKPATKTGKGRGAVRGFCGYTYAALGICAQVIGFILMRWDILEPVCSPSTIVMIALSYFMEDKPMSIAKLRELTIWGVGPSILAMPAAKVTEIWTMLPQPARQALRFAGYSLWADAMPKIGTGVLSIFQAHLPGPTSFVTSTLTSVAAAFGLTVGQAALLLGVGYGSYRIYRHFYPKESPPSIAARTAVIGPAPPPPRTAPQVAEEESEEETAPMRRGPPQMTRMAAEADPSPTRSAPPGAAVVSPRDAPPHAQAQPGRAQNSDRPTNGTPDTRPSPRLALASKVGGPPPAAPEIRVNKDDTATQGPPRANNRAQQALPLTASASASDSRPEQTDTKADSVTQAKLQHARDFFAKRRVNFISPKGK
jgi:hypothetical protein